MLKRALPCGLQHNAVNGRNIRRTIGRTSSLSSLLTNRRRGLVAVFGLLVMSLSLGSLLLSAAQTSDQSSSDRKMITRIEPEYPDALKRLYIGGVVRVEVVVAPNGTVKSTKLLGGSPILGQSTMKAIKQWRYAPAASEETLTVRLEFDPHR
jgi:TonB family protein